MKKILVIMPLYNREDLVGSAIESVLQQTYENWELVIIDDKSTDESLKVIEKYRDNPKITILENTENRGCYYSRNRGLVEFQNKDWDLFTIHDPDDISSDTRFETLVKNFDNAPTLASLKTTYIKVYANTREPIVDKNGKYDVYCSEGIAMFSRKGFQKIGFFDNTRFSGDTDYVIRMESLGDIDDEITTGEDYNVLYICQVHPENLLVTHPIEERIPYYVKINEDIKEMIQKRNFYRPFIL